MRIETLRAVLHACLERRPLDGADVCRTALDQSGDPWMLSLWSFTLVMAQDHTGADAMAQRAAQEARDPDERAFALAAMAWARTGSGTTRDRDPLAEGVAAIADLDPRSDIAAFTVYVLAEAALASARLDLAAGIVAAGGPVPTDFLAEPHGEAHPYTAVMQVMRVRLLGFQGSVTAAMATLETIDTRGHRHLDLLVGATSCLLRGNNAERNEVRGIADRLEHELGDPVDHISSGCYLLVAYGLIANGDTARAAAFVLRAGGSAGLDDLLIVDRALGLEMLVAEAIATDDLGAAQSWRHRAADLLDDPISRSTVERINSRVALLEADAAAAARWAEGAVLHAEADGRAIERAEGEVVLSRARIALSERGAASVALEAMAARAADSGHRAATRAAARELRAIGRRLRPRAGSGWDGLSERERDVALLVAEGFGNQAIARELHLSEHTVQAHVSRVLAAFGAASRVIVAAELARALPADPDATPPPALTPRQDSVARLIANGQTNERIAAELGVSVKTVEKHVSEILRRWEVSSRIGIARLALRSPEVPLRG